MLVCWYVLHYRVGNKQHLLPVLELILIITTTIFMVLVVMAEVIARIHLVHLMYVD